MTKANRLGPLVSRQFRVLRWFAVMFVCVVAFFLVIHWNGFVNEANGYWQGAGLIGYRDWTGMAMIYARDAPGCLAYMAALTLLMAVWQQADALHSRSAQLMASMPVTRGRMLQAQLLSGVAILFGATALYAAGCCFISWCHREIFELGAMASPFPGQLLSQIGPRAPLLIALRLFMTLVSGYLAVSVLLGLFGNLMVSIGALLCLALWGAAWLGYGYGSQLSMQLHALGFLPAVRFSRVFELLGIGLPIDFNWLRPYSHYYIIMPWDGLSWFIPIHLAAWALGLCCLWQQRKRLALERLGGFFLFPASRWAVLGMALLWMLPFPLLSISTYNPVTQGYDFDPLCLLWLIPMGMVFAALYWLLIRRPKMRINKRLAALALALLLIAPSASAGDLNIEPEFFSYGPGDLRVGWRYAPEKISIDIEWGERINALCSQISDIVTENQRAFRELGGIVEYGEGCSGVATPLQLSYSANQLVTYDAYDWT